MVCIRVAARMAVRRLLRRAKSQVGARQSLVRSLLGRRWVGAGLELKYEQSLRRLFAARLRSLGWLRNDTKCASLAQLSQIKSIRFDSITVCFADTWKSRLCTRAKRRGRKSKLAPASRKPLSNRASVVRAANRAALRFHEVWYEPSSD